MDYDTQKSFAEIKQIVGNENLKEALRTAAMILETARGVTETRMRRELAAHPGHAEFHGYWTQEFMQHFADEIDDSEEAAA